MVEEKEKIVPIYHNAYDLFTQLTRKEFKEKVMPFVKAYYKHQFGEEYLLHETDCGELYISIHVDRGYSSIYFQYCKERFDLTYEAKLSNDRKNLKPKNILNFLFYEYNFYFINDEGKKVGSPKKKVYQYSLDGYFIKEWDGISKIDVITTTANIASAIKRHGTVGGFIWSYEFKDKLHPQIKYQMPNKYIDIQQIDKKTNEVINTFETALQIEQELGLIKGSRNKIYDCLKGTYKTAYGYKWKLKNE